MTTLDRNRCDLGEFEKQLHLSNRKDCTELFLLRNRSVQYKASGVLQLLPSGGTNTLNDRVESHFQNDGSRKCSSRECESADSAEQRTYLVGAIPFNPDQHDSLYQPVDMQVTSNPTLVDSTDRGLHSRGIGKAWDIQQMPSGKEYASSVERAIRMLSTSGEGLLRKIVLARSLLIETGQTVDPLALISKLPADPLATTFLTPLKNAFTSAPVWFAGATPELLISKRGSEVISHPLAGSARRSDDPVLDQLAAEELLASTKDRYEHRFVVTAIEEALGPFCKELKIPNEPSLYSTATMWHLGTRISGILKDPATNVASLVAAIHPTPAVCGTPQRPALQAILDAEQFDRGFYGGTVGWIDDQGDGEWYVAIRCARIEGSSIQLFAGAGIVPYSDPETELQETIAKFQTWLNALGIENYSLV